MIALTYWARRLKGAKSEADVNALWARVPYPLKRDIRIIKLFASRRKHLSR